MEGRSDDNTDSNDNNDKKKKKTPPKNVVDVNGNSNVVPLGFAGLGGFGCTDIGAVATTPATMTRDQRRVRRISRHNNSIDGWWRRKYHQHAAVIIILCATHTMGQGSTKG